MSKQTPTVEWIVAESEADWDRLCAPSIPDLAPPTNNRMGRKGRLWVVGTLLLLLVNVSGWWSHGKPNALRQPTFDEVVTLYAAPLALGADRRSLVDTIIGDQMTKEWRQTEPDAALWGPARTLETTNFVYHFRQNDEQTVVAVAAQVDALYATMQRNLGLPIFSGSLPISRGGEKLVIEVNLTSRPGAAPSRPSTDSHFSVPSPALYLAPVALSDAQILAQSIALPLLDYLLVQASKHQDLPSSWQPLLDGLRLWQLWNLELPLALWREDVVQWLYADLPTAAARQPPPLPDRYADLCAAHQLWLLSPSQVGIPLRCSRLKLEATYFPWYYLNPPTHLAQFNLPLAQHDQLKERRDRGLSVAIATLIEYAVVTYGQEQLPVLVAGLGQYDSWETLLPAVYGVSPATFEAGWQVYLGRHYGVSLETITHK